MCTFCGKEVFVLNKTCDKIVAQFSAKATWITLWVLAAASLLVSLRALAVVKPNICIAMCIAAFVFSLAGMLVGVCAGKTKLEIDGNLIFCSKICKKRCYMPLSSVTGVKVGIFNTICIVSPSLKIRCCFVKNRDEFIEALKKNFDR